MSALLAILADEWDGVPNLRVNGVVPGPMRSPLRAQSHPGDDVTRLPPPERLVPLYLYLLNGQPKAQSGGVMDGQAWLRERSSARFGVP